MVGGRMSAGINGPFGDLKNEKMKNRVLFRMGSGSEHGVVGVYFRFASQEIRDCSL